MTLLQLFARCLEVPYLQAEESANYYTERIGGILYIYLQSSDGGEDWKNNLDFPARPYKQMGKTVWYAHRGFVRVWRAIEPRVAPLIADPLLQGIVTVGYSHGGAYVNEKMGNDTKPSVFPHSAPCVKKICRGILSPAYRYFFGCLANLFAYPHFRHSGS